MNSETIPNLDIGTLSSVIANINSLYSNLVSYTVGLILVIGALIPLIISYLQQRQFKAEQEAIRNQISNEVKLRTDSMEEELQEKFKRMLTNELNAYKLEAAERLKEIERDVYAAQAGAYHVQANANEDSPVICIGSCADALLLYFQANSERNIRSILAILENNIEKLSKDDFEANEDLKENIDAMLKLLTDNNQNGRYSIDLEDLKRAYSVARKREKAS